MSTGYESNYPSTGYASESQVRNEFAKIQVALDDTISRTGQGSGSNAMDVDLDLNGNDILNVNVLDAQEIMRGGVPLTQNLLDSVERAELAASQAETSAAEADQALEDLGNIWQGAYSEQPTQRPDGSSLVSGDVFFNLDKNYLEVWTGSSWQYAGTGPQGPQGERGPQGFRGEQGLTGPVGPTGPVGMQGIQGAIGDIGPKGDKGDTGPTGPQGIQGVMGPVGPMGPEGPVGPMGPQGVKGERGDDGSSFAIDAMGTLAERDSYDDEPRGFSYYAEDVQAIESAVPFYEQFNYSATNSYTLTGTPSGEQSVVVTVNNIVQSPNAYTFDVDGDEYTLNITASAGDVIGVRGIDNSTSFGAIFFKMSNASGDWSDAIPFGRGPAGLQGPAGIAGPQGEQGPVGPQGPQGPAGVTGPQGPIGEQGLKGDKGETGDRGPVGIQGETGPTGPQGPQGIQGPSGEDGPVGPQGIQGPIGLTGPAGPQGAKGNTGPQGIQGPTGPQGPAGAGALALTSSNTNITASTTTAHNRVIEVSENSTATGARVAVIGSSYSHSEGSNSVAIASSGSYASKGSGSYNTVLSSQLCQNTWQFSSVLSSAESHNEGRYSIIACSEGVRNTGSGQLVIGQRGSIHNISTDNQKIKLVASSGRGHFKGGTTTSGFDYAEYFPNLENGVIPDGTIVTLDGKYITPAKQGDKILGTITATAGVVGNSQDFANHKQHLYDDFGRMLMTEYPAFILNGETCLVKNFEGQVPEDAEIFIHKVPTPNPEYVDMDNKYVSREDRPEEWSVVALMGQVYTRVYEDINFGEYVSADGKTSKEETNLYCMEMSTPYSEEKGYGVAFCLLR